MCGVSSLISCTQYAQVRRSSKLKFTHDYKNKLKNTKAHKTQNLIRGLANTKEWLRIIATEEATKG
jgi:hypothetical protein